MSESARAPSALGCAIEAGGSSSSPLHMTALLQLQQEQAALGSALEAAAPGSQGQLQAQGQQ